MAEIREINNAEDFNTFINTANSLNVVKLGASWCGQCRVVENSLHALTDEEVASVLLSEVDVDDEWFEDILNTLNVRGIPVLLAYKDGEEKDRLIGSATKDTIIDFLGRNK